MTLEIDEKHLASNLDSMKRMSEAKDSQCNPYGKLYSDYIRAYSDIGLYVTFVDGHHVIAKCAEM